jgi:hypothetical protein
MSWATPLQHAAAPTRGGPRPAGAIRPAAAAAGAAGAAAAAERSVEVHVDGLVVLKIIKHCRDAFPENVAGTLLGFEKDDGQGGPASGTLEVTHAFPMPMDDSEEANVGYDQRYEVRMIKALKEVRRGWQARARPRRAARAQSPARFACAPPADAAAPPAPCPRPSFSLLPSPDQRGPDDRRLVLVELPLLLLHARHDPAPRALPADRAVGGAARV